MTTRIAFAAAFVIAIAPLLAPADDVGPPAVQPGYRSKVHHQAAGTPDADGWCEAKPTDGHFRVLLPARFVDTTEWKPLKQDRPGQQAKSTRAASVATNTNAAHFSAIELVPTEHDAIPPSRKVDEDMREAITDRATRRQKAEGGVVYDTRKFDVHGFPAVELRMQNNGRIIISRSICTPQRLFTLVSRYPADRHSVVAPQVKRFFDSFQFDPPRQATYPPADEGTRPSPNGR
jgi:hypothetical protein